MSAIAVLAVNGDQGVTEVFLFGVLTVTEVPVGSAQLAVIEELDGDSTTDPLAKPVVPEEFADADPPDKQTASAGLDLFAALAVGWDLRRQEVGEGHCCERALDRHFFVRFAAILAALAANHRTMASEYDVIHQAYPTLDLSFPLLITSVNTQR